MTESSRGSSPTKSDSFFFEAIGDRKEYRVVSGNDVRRLLSLDSWSATISFYIPEERKHQKFSSNTSGKIRGKRNGLRYLVMFSFDTSGKKGRKRTISLDFPTPPVSKTEGASADFWNLAVISEWHGVQEGLKHADDELQSKIKLNLCYSPSLRAECAISASLTVAF